MVARDYVRWRLWTSNGREKAVFAAGSFSFGAAIFCAVLGDWSAAAYAFGTFALSLALFLFPSVARGWLHPEPIRRSAKDR